MTEETKASPFTEALDQGGLGVVGSPGLARLLLQRLLLKPAIP